MRDAQMKDADVFLARECRRLPMQHESGRFAALAHHFDLAPADVAVPSGAQRLHRCFFCCKSRRIALIAWHAARFAILDFAFSEYARTKTLPGALAQKRALDTVDFNCVDAGAQDLRHQQPRRKVSTPAPHVSIGVRGPGSLAARRPAILSCGRADRSMEKLWQASK